jgi:segregation and condensation protein B
MEINQVKKIIEALLFVTDHPLSTQAIKDILSETGKGYDIEALVKEISKEYDENASPMELKFVAEGWQFATRKEFGVWIQRLYKEKMTVKLSVSSLETLSIIAYKQPITRSEIEEIRGVEVTGVLETLMERGLIKIAGRKETIGRPLLYGTTMEFLKHFGLKHLGELPVIEEMSSEDAQIQKNSEEPENISEEKLETTEN